MYELEVGEEGGGTGTQKQLCRSALEGKDNERKSPIGLSSSVETPSGSSFLLKESHTEGCDESSSLCCIGEQARSCKLFFGVRVRGHACVRAPVAL